MFVESKITGPVQRIIQYQVQAVSQGSMWTDVKRNQCPHSLERAFPWLLPLSEFVDIVASSQQLFYKPQGPHVETDPVGLLGTH